MPVVSWLAANCVKTMWLAEHSLHSDSGYLPKELIGQRAVLSVTSRDANGIKKFSENAWVLGPHRPRWGQIRKRFKYSKEGLFLELTAKLPVKEISYLG